LLQKVTSHTHSERSFVQKLAVECGVEYTRSMSIMLKDIALSSELHSAYTKLPHEGFPNGIAHDVMVLQSNVWPERIDTRPVIPSSLLHCQETYESFYTERHSGRKLQWIYHCGTLTLITTCFRRKHLLVAPVYQGLLLMQFNTQATRSLGDLCALTQLPKTECVRHLSSLTARKHCILSGNEGKEGADTASFTVNADFVSDKLKVQLSMGKREQVEKSVECGGDRRHIVDATIIRIMKARKRLNHTALMDEVLTRCILFKPQPAMVKTQVEHLINREFLERDDADRSVYLYIP